MVQTNRFFNRSSHLQYSLLLVFGQRVKSSGVANSVDHAICRQSIPSEQVVEFLDLRFRGWNAFFNVGFKHGDQLVSLGDGGFW